MASSESTASVVDEAITAKMAALCIYGQTPQPEETPEFLSKSHAALLTELDKLPSDEKKAGWTKAFEKCPNLVGEDHRLMFLRCEVFNEELAALRICKYWNRRIELFGENRAYKPIHLGGDGALSSSSTSDSEHDNTKQNDEDEAMVKYTMKGINLGFFRPTLTHDTGGRAIVFVDPSRLAGYNKNSVDERMGVARALWYIMHNAIEGNDAVQKLGMVAIAHPQHAKISVIDRKLMKLNLESMSGCLPIRMGGFHIVQPPWFFTKIVFPIMKVIMPDRMRKRVRVYGGSEAKILKELKEVGLGREVLPSEIGGDVILDTESWIQEMTSRGL
mmetsp:Transcript_3423/g.6585  ORF Transcript_3423/g.6585 Transcript_3423/m.6585 type:complete len:331 (+) Transcript_3423:247-1239(+)|eukprot:CAMPEP_0201625328 /NCGR_PEP_ID=MMETSP0493-20130528/1165_1 /ASSEMBLY_ACC=CAM_ASM_000838 /TAXON_ID=420259 /ORGANISM="Thalassiosira gravida, Strain GMp14c1" /LENGTH=330 /DNA_ID=CAMNT_0048095293 /DNA_START=13 /DNA_END=1005 /DNA_ORIENTATION=+